MENREELSRANTELRRYLNLDEDFWIPNGMRWFNDENKNIKFFHANVNGRRKRLNIDEIYIEEGDIINTRENIRAEAARYFADQFNEDFYMNDDEMLKCIPQLIFDVDNCALTEISFHVENKEGDF